MTVGTQKKIDLDSAEQTCASLTEAFLCDSDLPFGYEAERALTPWVTRRYPLSLRGLHEELIDVYYWLRPSHIETVLRYQVFEKVKKVVLERWSHLNGLRVSVFGSLRTRLFLPSSDIDVLVEYEGWPREAPPEVMEETAAILRSNPLFKSVSVLSNTPVPIIKVVDRDTSINIDISFNTVQGVRAAEYIDKVKADFPVFEPLVFFLKQFLNERRLNQTYAGGLSSYGLILMIHHFLQTNYAHLHSLYIGDPQVNLGVVLMRFLEIYALEFNYFDMAIQVKERRFIRKPLTKGNGGPPNGFLSIEDPLLAGNDVGRSTYNMQNVRAAFERALVSLRSVFIIDRPRCSALRERYSGSIVGHLLSFMPDNFHYRAWLKGFTLKWRPKEEPQQAETMMLLAPGISKTFVQSVIEATRLRKVISIVNPDDVSSNGGESGKTSCEEDCGEKGSEMSHNGGRRASVESCGSSDEVFIDESPRESISEGQKSVDGSSCNEAPLVKPPKTDSIQENAQSSANPDSTPACDSGEANDQEKATTSAVVVSDAQPVDESPTESRQSASAPPSVEMNCVVELSNGPANSAGYAPPPSTPAAPTDDDNDAGWDVVSRARKGRERRYNSDDARRYSRRTDENDYGNNGYSTENGYRRYQHRGYGGGGGYGWK